MIAVRRHCEHQDCDLPIEPQQFACYFHWLSLPKDVRMRIKAAATASTRARTSEAALELRAAQDTALDWWLSH